MYYLQSRYYDPEVGRFLNADAYTSTGQGILGNNMFAYCLNNPIRYKDTNGQAVQDCFDETDDRSDPFDDMGSRGGGGPNGGPNGGFEGGGTGSLGVHSYYTSGVTQYSNGGSGTGSMIGDSAYQNAKAAGTTCIPEYGGMIEELAALLKGNSSSQCFVEGTMVRTAKGTIPIEDVKTGDFVWAWNEYTGEVALKRVVETYVNETIKLVHIFVCGEEIISTPNHPFYSPVKGWTDAANLRAGDILVLVNGEYVVVEKVQHELLEVPTTVYNFHVEDAHTYYVTNVGVLVHNRCINDRQTHNTSQESIQFDTEGQARSFARTKVGHNPVSNGPGKLVSANMHWQYRAKPVDFLNGHIHLERLNPTTGEVITNYHLWW